MEIADTLMTEIKSTVNTNECNVDDFVAVMYDGMVYVAKVQEIVTEDGEYQYFFHGKSERTVQMAKNGGHFMGHTFGYHWQNR